MAGLFALCVSVPGESRAEAITPSHVYQVVENTQAEVLLLLDANFSPTDIPAEQMTRGRLPRHVIQETHHLLRQVTLLREINSQSTRPVEAIPVREIRPVHVKASVDRLLAEIKGLREPFGIESEPAPARLRDGKTPVDVHARLRVIGELIQRLDLPSIVPNDVYRVAMAVKADAELIHKALNAPVPAPIPSDIEGKKPPHVYARSFDLLANLKQLVERTPGLAIPGGVNLPRRKTENIVPADVLGMMLNILAELSSLKAVTRATEPTPTISPQVGKNPTDVYIVVEETIAILDAIRKAS